MRGVRHEKTVIKRQMDELKSQLDALSKALPENKIALIVFSGDLVMVLAAFILAYDYLYVDEEHTEGPSV